MVKNAEEEGAVFATTNDSRVTPFGKIMRKSRMDEIPQFINILKGDMSLVGPRPLLMDWLENYTAEQRLRHNVLPGVTGWAQINGRNIISFPKKFEYPTKQVVLKRSCEGHQSYCIVVRSYLYIVVVD